jgi:hypothetical protein
MVKSFGTTYTQPITVFIVFKINDNRTQFLFDGPSSGVNRLATYYNAGAGQLLMFAGDNFLAYNGLPSTFKILTGQYNGGTSKSYINNSLVNQAGSPQTTPMDGLTLGSTYFNTSVLNGAIKEFIIYNSILTIGQITNVNNYLNSKYIIY